MMNSNYESVIQFRKSLRSIRRFHLFFCLLGLFISIYTVYVELHLAQDPGYQALCDISPDISCTRVFSSEWGTGFGFMKYIAGENSTLNQPNGFFGVTMYPIFIFTSRFEYMFLANFTLLLGTLGVAMSGYLGYVMFYILDGICVICLTIYVINFFLFITSVMYYRNMKSLKLVLKPPVSPSPQPMGEVKKRV